MGKIAARLEGSSFVSFWHSLYKTLQDASFFIELLAID